MTKGPLGYGRYDDDPKHVGCPRAKSDMTPCVARDGHLAMSLPSKPKEPNGVCIGCGNEPSDLLRDLVLAVTEPEFLNRTGGEGDG